MNAGSNRTAGILTLPQAGLLWGIGVYLRLPMLLVAPLMPQLTASLRLNATQIDSLLTLPLVLLGVGALFSARIVRLLNPWRALVLGLAVVGCGSAARVWIPTFAVLLGWTALFGLGVALLQVALPVYLRDRALDVARATAIYTNGLLVGEVLVTVSTPALVHVLGAGWRLAFLLWTSPLFVLLGLFLFTGGRAGHAPAGAADGGTAPAWWSSVRLGVIMSGSASMYFAANAYLPRVLDLSGQGGLIAPGLGMLNGAQLLASVWLIWLGRRALRGAAHLLGFALCACAGLAGLLLLSAGWADLPLAGVCGFGTAGMLTLVLSRATRTGDAHTSRRVVSRTLFVGYTLAFVLPSFGGWLADRSGWPAAALLPPLLWGMVGVALLAAEAAGPPLRE